MDIFEKSIRKSCKKAVQASYLNIHNQIVNYSIDKPVKITYKIWKKMYWI